MVPDKIIYVDGGTGNGGRICLIDGSKKIVKQRGNLTNNELEYLAVIFSQEYIRTLLERGQLDRFSQVLVCSDSKLIVNQLKNIYRVTKPELGLLKQKLENLAQRNSEQLGSLDIKWVPRNKNKAGIELERLLKRKH